jgi:hypothetical protein
MNSLKTLLVALVGFSAVACGGQATGDSTAAFCIEQRDFPAVYSAALQDAVDEWNYSVGSNLTVKHGGCEGWDIRVSLGDHSDNEVGAGHDAMSWKERGSTPNTLFISPGFDIPDPNLKVEPRARIRSRLLHEVGHNLGLGHSSNESDIMYPMAKEDAHLSQGDLDAYWAARGVY